MIMTFMIFTLELISMTTMAGVAIAMLLMLVALMICGQDVSSIFVPVSLILFAVAGVVIFGISMLARSFMPGVPAALSVVMVIALAVVLFGIHQLSGCYIMLVITGGHAPY
jgi:hypothetical protein